VDLLTDRLRLWEFTHEDWTFVHHYQNDSRYQRFYDQSEWSEDHCRDFVSGFVRQQDEVPRRKFQFVVEVDVEAVGICGIRRDAGSNSTGNMGFEIAPHHWRRRYATEAAIRVLAFGFRELKLNRVWAECIGDNTSSRRVLEKIGTTGEAHLQDHLWFKGRFWDRLLYGILRSEWEGDTV
jgi:ribosomal-protein-alanine N-acetyltransferase